MIKVLMRTVPSPGICLSPGRASMGVGCGYSGKDRRARRTRSGIALFSAMLLVHLLQAQIEVISGGNVGIGTDSPAAKLHVSDSATATVRNVVWEQTSNDNGGFQLNIRKVRGSSGALLSDDAVFNLAVGGYDGSVFATGANIRAFASGNWSGSSHPTYLRFDTTGVNESTASPRMVISDAGNVGIGTTTPSSRLEIVDTSSGYGTNTAQLRIKGGHGGGTAYAGVRFAMLEHSTGWGADIQGYDDTAYYGGALAFRTGGGSATATPIERMRISSSGNVGIGTTGPAYKLEVVGTVRATSFVSNTATYADFVFKPGYRLAPLSEVEAHIAEHGHLPGIPSEAEAQVQGMDLAAMQVKLLQKIEELTLHVIRLDKENALLREKTGRMETAISP